MITHDEFGEPELLPTETSEIEACMDCANRCLDNVLRPVFINQEGKDFLELTVEDARRLLEFLNEAVPLLDAQLGTMKQ